MTDIKPRREPGWVPDLSTFGARLAVLRQAMGWGNVKQAAVLCAIPPESWRGWERDGLMPRSLITVCMKIAGVTGVDYRWLALGPAVERAAASPAAAQGVTRQYPSDVTRRYGTGARLVATITEDARPVVRAHPIGQHPMTFTASK